MKITLTPEYSGERSDKFWELVNSLPDAESQEMYFAGVLLQSMEEKVLGVLESYLNNLPVEGKS